MSSNSIRPPHRLAHPIHNTHSPQSIALGSLNRLLAALSIPISLAELSFVTPSLLLAVLESLLERRFLPEKDLHRTSRSPQSRSKCLTILFTILDECLDSHLDQWTSSSISLSKLLEADLNEMVKLINGLLKLSVRCNNPAAPIQSPISVHAAPSLCSPETNLLDSPRSAHAWSKNQAHSNMLKRASSASLISQIVSPLPSSSSDSSLKPARMTFTSLLSPLGPPLAQSSPHLPRHSPPHTNSLRRSLTQIQDTHYGHGHEHDHEHGYEPVRVRPPTLRHLLGPLQAQLAATRRPQTPRTAHRSVVAKLRDEEAWDVLRPNMDEETIMTLDGIGSDDPFVSMETRRAIEHSQNLRQRLSAERDQLLEPDSTEGQTSADTDSSHNLSTLRQSLDRIRKSNTQIPDFGAQENDGLQELRRSFGSFRSSTATSRQGLNPRQKSTHPRSSISSTSLHEPPHLIPLPASPEPQYEKTDVKVLLASSGARLELIDTDLRASELEPCMPSGWAWVTGAEMAGPMRIRVTRGTIHQKQDGLAPVETRVGLGQYAVEEEEEEEECF